jgi:hypothetical protein
MQRPGDINNCLDALSREEPLLTRLFHYRFMTSCRPEGHSFGNLFFTTITGSLETVMIACSRVLPLQGTGGLEAGVIRVEPAVANMNQCLPRAEEIAEPNALPAPKTRALPKLTSAALRSRPRIAEPVRSPDRSSPR